MANMTASISRRYKGDPEPQKYGCVGYTDYGSGSTAYTIYKGAIVCIEPDDVDGYAQPNVSGLTPDSAFVFLGVAMEEVSVTSSDTSQGDKEVLVARGGVWAFPVGSITVTDIGAPAYASDDQTVGTSSTNTLWIGTIVFADASYAWVDISHAAGRANSAT